MSDDRMETMADEDLALLSITNSEAFGVLMRRYQGRLLAYIRRISGFRAEDAEDILQESYIKAYLNLRDFDKKLKFSSWLYRIVHNETISEWRKRKSRPSIILENEDWEKISSEEDLHGALTVKADKERLAGAIAKLPEKYREAIVLKYLEERSYEEMADILRKPVGTIGTLVNRAKKHLQKILK